MADNIVKSDSKGYGYKYASLADIAEQGFDIPKMKTGTDNGKEYVYYFDAEIKEWIRGAEIVVPDQMKGANKTQMYGSALTYARRYTVMMADCLASQEDKEIESQEEQKSGIFDEPIPKADKKPAEMSVKTLVKLFKDIYPIEAQIDIFNKAKVSKAEELPHDILAQLVQKAFDKEMPEQTYY